jgi:hypothetical protein
MIVLLGASAMSIDMSRIWAMRNELQTAADAGALAGAIQLTPPYAPAYAADTATAFALRNRAFYDVVNVDSVQVGTWDDSSGTFNVGAAPTNAVHVVVSHNTNRLIIGMLGIAAPRIKARATAWANAPVNQASCVKPWTVPYVILMSRLNVARGINPPNSAANLSRAFDQNLDVAALNTMSESARTFQLKLGSGSIDDDAPGGAMPGNFQAVQLPRRWGAETQSYNPDGTPGSGGNDYRASIAGPECHTLDVGDSLSTEPGNMVGPTIQGVTADPGICQTLVGEDTNAPANDPTFGDCLDANGQNGVAVKAGFYFCSTKCNGSSMVAVKMLGSFTLKKIYPDKSKKNATPAFDKSEIVGVFNPISASGPIGPGPTTLSRLILVK